jgi:tRNA(Ile)-lysidine synthase
MTPSEALDRLVTQKGLPQSGHLVVAVSGGLDSTVLAHLVSKATYDWTITLATVDHGLHSESVQHADSVERLADRLGVSYIRLRADPGRIAAGEGLEDGCRRERYRLLGEFLAEAHGVALLTGHTADDQAETMLMRLGEGGGLSAFRGVPEKRGLIVRPLLWVTRAAIVAYAQRWELSGVKDPTNDEQRFRRNAVRQRIKPAMTQVFGDSWVRCASRVARNMADVEDVVADALSRSFGGAVEMGDDWLSVRRSALREASLPLQRVFWADLMSGRAREHFGAFARPSGKQIAALIELTQTGHQGQSRDLGELWFVCIEGEGLTFRRRDAARERVDPAPVTPFEIVGPGRYTYGEWHLEIGTPQPFAAGGGEDFLPLKLASFPWRVRSVFPGEVFRPRGAPGRKKVSKLWIDARFPAYFRHQAPSLEVNGRLAWVAGLRVGHDLMAEVGNMGVTVRCWHQQSRP